MIDEKKTDEPAAQRVYLCSEKAASATNSGNASSEDCDAKS